jgi:hypothetical protein
MHDEFCEVWNRVEARYIEFKKPIRQFPNTPYESRLSKKTPEVKNEKGQVFWLEKHEGSESEWTYLITRYPGTRSSNVLFKIFYGDVYRLGDLASARETGNVKMQRECMDILKFMDQNLPPIEDKEN